MHNQVPLRASGRCECAPTVSSSHSLVCNSQELLHHLDITRMVVSHLEQYQGSFFIATSFTRGVAIKNQPIQSITCNDATLKKKKKKFRKTLQCVPCESVNVFRTFILYISSSVHHHQSFNSYIFDLWKKVER